MAGILPFVIVKTFSFFEINKISKEQGKLQKLQCDISHFLFNVFL